MYHVQMPTMKTQPDGTIEVELRQSDWLRIVAALAVDATSPTHDVNDARPLALTRALVATLPAGGQEAVRERCRAVRRERRRA